MKISLALYSFTKILPLLLNICICLNVLGQSPTAFSVEFPQKYAQKNQLKPSWIVKVKFDPRFLIPKNSVHLVSENSGLLKYAPRPMTVGEDPKLFLKKNLPFWLYGQFEKMDQHKLSEAEDSIDAAERFALKLEYIEENSPIHLPKNEIPEDESGLKPRPNENLVWMEKALSSLTAVYDFNDLLFPKQWALSNTGANFPEGDLRGIPGIDIHLGDVLSKYPGRKDIRIAVLDTGIDYTHPDLLKNIWRNELELNGISGYDDDDNGYIDDFYGYNFVANNSNPMDDHRHGTHCAGTIGATRKNNLGIVGLLDQTSLMALKFLNEKGQGDNWDAVLAIDYAIKNKAKIISCSWVSSEYSQSLKEAFLRAEKAGIFTIAAAGNDTQDLEKYPQYPASFNLDNILSVAALNQQNVLSAFSNYSAKFVHLAAPGSQILSTSLNADYQILSGTSMAAPFVSAALALLMSKYLQEGKAIPAPVVLKKKLIDSVSPSENLVDKVQSKGRLNLENLLNEVYPPKDQIKEWFPYRLKPAFESKHPYQVQTNLKRSIKIPGAKAIRILIEKFDFDVPFAFLKLREPQSSVVSEEIHGSGENRISSVIIGDAVEIDFNAGFSKNSWGFRISQVEYFK